MPQRVVKLKPDKAPLGPAIRLRRGKSTDGETYPFVVGGLDEKGFEDFRGCSEYQDYDSALKAAADLAHKLRLPVQYASGLEPEQKAEKPAHAQAKAIPNTAPPPLDRSVEKSLEKKLQPLGDKFSLPDVSSRMDDALIDDIASRGDLLHRYAREHLRNNYAEQFGATNDRPVAYTQRSHDLIQWQIGHVFQHMLAIQANVYAQLEAAHKRIDELQRKALTVDRFKAQVADDDRTIELSFGSGKERRVASFKWPTMIDRGVYQPDREYEAGDVVTHAGSAWTAQRSTTTKPDTANSGWRLMVKRGRDGKDGR